MHLEGLFQFVKISFLVNTLVYRNKSEIGEPAVETLFDKCVPPKMSRVSSLAI